MIRLNGENFLFKNSAKEIRNYLSKASTVRRGPYFLSEEVTEKYEKVRYEIADLLGVSSREIIFASPGDLSKLLKSMRKIYKIEEIGDFDSLEKLNLLITTRHIQGIMNIINFNPFISRTKVNIKMLDIDALYFNSEFLYGPNDLLIFYVKKEILENIEPYEHGGGMIKKVTFYKSSFADPPYKFEAGTPNISSILSLKPALQFIKEYIDELDKLFVSLYLSLGNIVDISINDLNKTIKFKKDEVKIIEILREQKIDVGNTLQLSIYNDLEDINKVIATIKERRF